jgi:iron complex outermembrane receptor protein
MSRGTRCFLPLVLLTAAPLGQAAASPLETVVVYGERTQRYLSETASLNHVLDAEDLQRPGLEHAAQALSEAPGVWVSRGSGQEQLVAIRSPVFTGAGACGAFWLAEDGIALRATGFCNANEFFDSHYEAAEQIEVFKGPHASIVGGNAQFGAFNVRLPNARALEEMLTLHANGLGYRRLQLQGGADTGAHALGLLATGIEDDGTRASSGFKQQKVSLRHDWQGRRDWVSVESGLSWMQLEQETAGYVVGEGAYRDREARSGNLFPEAYRDAEALRAYSRWRWRQLDSEWTFTPYARHNRMDFLMHFVPWQPVETNGHDSLGWQLQWRRYLVSGTEIYWSQEFDQTWGELSEIQYIDAPPPLQQGQIPRGVHYDYSVSARTAALSAGAFWQATPTLALDVALRWDHTRYDYTNNLSAGSACAQGVSGCRFYRPPSQDNAFSEPSAHLGLVYHWRDQLYAFGKLATGFRVPQTAELYRTQSADTSAVDSEKITSAEIGLRGQWGNWFAQGAFYAMRNRDGIVQDTQRRYVNGVDTEHVGFEYELQYSRANWSVNLGGQIADHTYVNNPRVMGVAADLELRGNQLDTAPKHMHQASGKWQVSERVSTGFRLAYLGRYYLDEANAYEYPGHTLLDLEIHTRISRQLGIRWALLNATDRAYADRADSAFGEYRYFPGLERRLSLTLNYRF